MVLTRRELLGLLAVPAVVRAAPFERHPYVQNVRSDRAAILWTTREPGAGVVEFGSDGLFSRTASAVVTEYPPDRTGLPDTFYQYEARLGSLQPGVEYTYRVRVEGQPVGSAASFLTAGSGPFSFAALGDSGCGEDTQRAVLRRIEAEAHAPAFVIHTGDLAYEEGTFAQLEQNHFTPYRSFLQRVCLFPAPGNHEYYTGFADPFRSVHSVPVEGVPAQGRGHYYSFDWGNAHFVCLDSNRATDAAMLAWLDRDLAITRQFWRIVYMHHPPYTAGRHELTQDVLHVRLNIVPYLEKHHVQIVFAGHDHNYQRMKVVAGDEIKADRYAGPTYVITGGGGGPLFDVNPDYPLLEVARKAHHYVWVDVQGATLKMRVMGVDPAVQIDTVEWTPPPVLAADSVMSAGDFSRRLAVGGIAAIFGRQLAPEQRAASAPLPSSLEGLQVTLNGRALRLFFVSSGQVNVQLPFDVQGVAKLRVVTAGGAAEADVAIRDVAPVILQQGRWAAIAHAASGELVTDASPAIAGETLTVYALGLGAVDGNIAAGEAASRSALVRTRAAVRIEVGGVTIVPDFAGLAPGYAGLYQVNVTLPAGLANGVYSMRATAGGAASNPVSLLVGWTPEEPEVVARSAVAVEAFEGLGVRAPAEIANRSLESD